MFYNSAIIVLSFANKVVKVQPQKFVCSSYPVSGRYIWCQKSDSAKLSMVIEASRWWPKYWRTLPKMNIRKYSASKTSQNSFLQTLNDKYLQTQILLFFNIFQETIFFFEKKQDFPRKLWKILFFEGLMTILVAFAVRQLHSHEGKS